MPAAKLAGLAITGLILTSCYVDAYLAGAPIKMHRGALSASPSRRPLLSRARGGLILAKAQLKSGDEKRNRESAVDLLGEALGDAVGKYNSGDLSEGASERPSWLPLIYIPVSGQTSGMKCYAFLTGYF